MKEKGKNSKKPEEVSLTLRAGDQLLAIVLLELLDAVLVDGVDLEFFLCVCVEKRGEEVRKRKERKRESTSSLASLALARSLASLEREDVFFSRFTLRS